MAGPLLRPGLSRVVSTSVRSNAARVGVARVPRWLRSGTRGGRPPANRQSNSYSSTSFTGS
jgi:hypothetical protein